MESLVKVKFLSQRAPPKVRTGGGGGGIINEIIHFLYVINLVPYEPGYLQFGNIITYHQYHYLVEFKLVDVHESSVFFFILKHY